MESESGVGVLLTVCCCLLLSAAVCCCLLSAVSFFACLSLLFSFFSHTFLLLAMSFSLFLFFFKDQLQSAPAPPSVVPRDALDWPSFQQLVADVCVSDLLCVVLLLFSFFHTLFLLKKDPLSLSAVTVCFQLMSERFYEWQSRSLLDLLFF